jgi:hypothetical protein
MHGWATSPNHRDHRGTITDLVTGHGCVDAVTIVRTKAGAVRGNHYHAKTTQWAYVASGRMVITDGVERLEVRAAPHPDRQQRHGRFLPPARIISVPERRRALGAGFLRRCL